MYKKKEFISKESNYINNLINFSKKILLNFRLIILFNIMKIFNRVLLGIGDWGLGIGDWGLGPIPNPQSPIPNPQSPFKIIF